MTVSALPGFTDPAYWVGAGGVFASAVLPAILVIVFIETGLLFPLLPGDSLLFFGGLLAAGAHPPVTIWALAPAVAAVAVLGDQCAYFIGRGMGTALFAKEDSRFFKQHHVTRSHAFFEKHGPKAVIIGRFLPIVRTFMPMVAGVAKMRYRVFLGFDIIGGIAWGAGVPLLGYFLGGFPFVERNIELMILTVGLLSLLPAIVSMVRSVVRRRRAPRERQGEPPAAKQAIQTRPDAEPDRAAPTERSAPHLG